VFIFSGRRPETERNLARDGYATTSPRNDADIVSFRRLGKNDATERNGKQRANEHTLLRRPRDRHVVSGTRRDACARNVITSVVIAVYYFLLEFFFSSSDLQRTCRFFSCVVFQCKFRTQHVISFVNFQEFRNVKRRVCSFVRINIIIILSQRERGAFYASLGTISVRLKSHVVRRTFL